MFPSHNPAQQVFNWHCQSNNIPESMLTSASTSMREPVRRIRSLYKQPISRMLPYDDPEFRAA